MTKNFSPDDASHLPGDRYAAGILLMTRSAPRQFLLLRHHDRWDLPKGHRDGSETDAETALRETEEETGLKRQQIQLDPDFRFRLSYRVKYQDSDPFEKHVTYFLGLIKESFRPDLTEHPNFQWFDWMPPHQIQQQTIDPLLHAVAAHLESDRIHRPG